MNTTLPVSVHDLIPADVLAKAARLALDTLVSILSDAKAAANERRIAALAILRLAFPTRAPQRARSASEGPTPSPALRETPSSAPPTAPPAVSLPITHHPLPDGRGSFTPTPTLARHIAALAGASPVTATRSPPSRLAG